MALHMNITKLIALDVVLQGIMAKTFDGRKPENLPKPSVVLEVAQKLLINFRKNFVQPDIAANGKWSIPPTGKSNLARLDILLPLADYASEHLAHIRLSTYDIPAVINSKNVSLDKIDTHIIPVLDEGKIITDYPPEVIDWVGDKARFSFGSVLAELRKSGVTCGQLQEMTLAEWEELSNAEYMTYDEEVATATTSKNGSADDSDELSQMSMVNITEEMLANAGGDEHISLYQENYDGTRYLVDDDAVSRARECTKILKGYYDIMDVQKDGKSNKLRTEFIVTAADESKKYWNERNDANKGAGIVINV